MEEWTELSPVAVRETLAPGSNGKGHDEEEKAREFQKQQRWKSRPLGLRKERAGAMERLGRAAVYCVGTAAREATGEKGREGGRGTGWGEEAGWSQPEARAKERAASVDGRWLMALPLGSERKQKRLGEENSWHPEAPHRRRRPMTPPPPPRLA